MCAFLVVTVTALFLSAESIIQLQSVTPPLKFTWFEPLLAQKSILNILILDLEFLDLTQHDFPVFVNLVPENEFTSWAPNQTKLYDRSNKVDIAILGSKPIQMLTNITRLLCGNWTGTDYNLERVPQCPLAMSEKFIVLAATSNRYEFEDVSEEDKDTLGRLSHALLFLWFEEADLRVAEILCEDGYYGSGTVEMAYNGMGYSGYFT